jgi:hypothetical protein
MSWDPFMMGWCSVQKLITEEEMERREDERRGLELGGGKSLVLSLDNCSNVKPIEPLIQNPLI